MFPLEDYEHSVDAVAFLARSTNRVTVLDALTDDSWERRELADATGVSRATLARILDDLVARGWATEDDRTYTATQVGEFVVGEFTGLLERTAAVEVLGRVSRWLPEAGFDFDLDCLATAEVVTTTRTDVLAPTTHLVRRLRRADRVRILSHAVFPDGIDANWERTVNGRQRVQAVLAPEAVAAIRDDPALARRIREMLATGRAAVYRYEGEVPHVLIRTGEEVNVVLFDAVGAPHAVICSENETVTSWADETIRSFRDEATPLTRDAFTA